MNKLDNSLNKLETLLNNPQSAAENIVLALEGLTHTLNETLQANTLNEAELISVQARVQMMLDSASNQQNTIGSSLRSVAQRLKAQNAYGANK